MAGPGVPSATTLGADPPREGAGRDATRAHRRLEMARSVHPRADAAAVAQYAGLVSDLRPDLVHAHSSKAAAVVRLGRLRFPRLPVVYTPHGYAFAGFFAHRFERVAYREAERALAPLTTRVIAVCRAEARLASSLGASRKVRVVLNGIEPQDAESDPDESLSILAGRGPIVCAVARLQAGKGIEILIDAMPAVLARHREAQLAVIGDGPLRTALRERASARGLEGSVHFLGEHANPRRALRSAQVFVLPSLAESLPYVLLEAMAAGLPIVASAVGGITEAIATGEDGLLVAPGNPEALSQALISILGDADLRARFGAHSRARVQREFTRAGMVAGLAAVYAEVLERRRDDG
jgi:glycosyltransferase involved in cell wall biosynthesis